jgi:hypothetical protein
MMALLVAAIAAWLVSAAAARVATPVGAQAERRNVKAAAPSSFTIALTGDSLITFRL